MERIVSNSGVVEVPQLTRTYHEWSLVTQVNLEALELWDAVEVECKDRAKDRRALAAILREQGRVRERGTRVPGQRQHGRRFIDRREAREI